jgi:hypothetical protein
MSIAVILSKAKNLKAMRPFTNAQGDNFIKSFTIVKIFVAKNPRVMVNMKKHKTEMEACQEVNSGNLKNGRKHSGEE